MLGRRSMIHVFLLFFETKVGRAPRGPPGGLKGGAESSNSLRAGRLYRLCTYKTWGGTCQRHADWAVWRWQFDVWSRINPGMCTAFKVDAISRPNARDMGVFSKCKERGGSTYYRDNNRLMTRISTQGRQASGSGEV